MNEDIPSGSIPVSIRFLTWEEGGRDIEVSSGIRPRITIGDCSSDCLVTFGDNSDHSLGQQLNACVSMLHPERFKGRIVPGIPFKLLEGGRVIAEGRII